MPKFYLGPRGTSDSGTPINSSEVGESGEGGLEEIALETDDSAFLIALKIIQAHYAIGLKLYKAHNYDVAENFFGHPISEVLAPLEPAFKHRKIESISEAMYNLLDIAQSQNNQIKLETEINKILEQISLIQSNFKKSNLENYPKLMATVNADLLRRSKLELIQAIKINSVGHLQDSIGYFDVAYELFNNHKALYQQNSKMNVAQIQQLFIDITPYFADFSKIDSTINTKKIAGTIARIELFLLNI
jgi:hypothetical protein